MDIFPSLIGKITEYDILVIGHLKWNPYFGETADRAPRGDPSTCTSTMIRGTMDTGKAYVLIVDPTLRNSPEDYYFDINRRTGLRHEAVTHCYVTHSHFDHQAGLNYFPEAVWCAAPPVAEDLRKSPYIDGKRVVEVEGEFLPGVSTVHLPGHMERLYGLAFEMDGKRYAVTGDGVMTKWHFFHGTTMFEEDKARAAETIRCLKKSMDYIIPGHDNLICNERGGGEAKDEGSCDCG